MVLKRIVIEPNETRLEDGYLKSGKMSYRKNQKHTTWPTESFLETLKFSSMLLPKNTKYHKSYQGGKRNIFITEYEPSMRNITIARNQFIKWESFNKWCEIKKIKDGAKQFERMKVTNSCKKQTFQLLIPYTVVYTMVDPNSHDFKFQIFMRNSPLSSFDDMLYKAPFYNIQNSQYVCMGSTFNRDVMFKMNVSQIVDSLYGAFWASQFNTDYSYNIRAYRYRQLFNNYFIWEYQSRYNPEKIFKSKYVAYQRLGEFLQQKDGMYKTSSMQFKNLLGFFK